MNIFIRNLMINMANVAVVTITDESAEIHTAGGKTVLINGPEFPWFLKTNGLVPGIRLEEQYADRARLESIVARDMEVIKAKREAALAGSEPTPTGTGETESLETLEEQLRQVDEAMSQAAKLGTIPSEVLTAARARRMQIAQTIQARLVAKEKVN